jgi:cytoskeleton protein RodZ
METIGDILKKKRLEKGYTLEEASNITKIRKKYLEALENCNYEEIPDKVYTKSFLKIYSEFLGLDKAHILKRFQEEESQDEKIIIAPIYYPPNDIIQEKHQYKRTLYVLIFILILVLLIWSAWSYILRNPSLFSRGPKSNDIPIEDINFKDNDIVTPPNLSPDIPAIETEKQNPIHFYDKLVLTILSNSSSWISISEDKSGVVSHTMMPNKEEIFEAKKSISLRIGNLGGIRMDINNFNLDTLGKSGEVADIVISLTQDKSIEVLIEKNGKIERKIYKD